MIGIMAREQPIYRPSISHASRAAHHATEVIERKGSSKRRWTLARQKGDGGRMRLREARTPHAAAGDFGLRVSCCFSCTNISLEYFARENSAKRLARVDFIPVIRYTAALLDAKSESRHVLSFCCC